MLEGIKVPCQLADSGTFDEFLGEEVTLGADVVSDDAIAAYIRQACDEEHCVFFKQSAAKMAEIFSFQKAEL
ncbi:hypothetical protein [Nostoc sp.]|uniref:hypothetical protein n=1 Tax=Nostoc sp. TaxID=1180 RepID=UPI002FF5FD0B